MAKKNTRNVRGLGSLYKRCSNGKDYPPTSKKAGVFWLKYVENGKRYRIPLEVDGKPVMNHDMAKVEQLRLRAPSLSGDKLEVLKKLQADITALEGQYLQDEEQANPPLTIDSAWEAYLNAANRPNSGSGTLKNYKGHWDAFQKRWLKEQSKEYVYLREISEADAGAFMVQLRSSGKSGNTFNKYLQFLRLFFLVLSKPARLRTNPFDDIQRLSQTPVSRRELTLTELHKVIYTAKGELKLLFQIGTFTGLRLGDCCMLQWEDIDILTRIIRRIPNKTKARNPKPVILGIPEILLIELVKIPEAQRSGPVLPGFASLYAERINQSKISRLIQKHFVVCGIRIHRLGTGAKYHYKGKKKVYENTQRAKIEVGFHSLRHTWVSLHAMSGTPQAIIQAAAGHSNPAMTAHYTHTSEDAARRVASALDLPQLAEAIDVEPIISEDTPEEIQRKKLYALIDNLSSSAVPRLIAYIEKYLSR